MQLDEQLQEQLAPVILSQADPIPFAIGDIPDNQPD